MFGSHYEFAYSQRNGYYDNPVVQITMFNGDERQQHTTAVIDSGAHATNISTEWADLLEIDYKGLPRTTVRMANSDGKEKENAWVGSIDIKIEGIPDKINIYALFVEGLGSRVLLGQRDFFEKFDISFHKGVDTNKFILKKPFKLSW